VNVTAQVWRVLAVGVLAVWSAGLQSADELDRFIHTQMMRRQIVGLSLAIVHNGRIAEARAYGTTTRNGKTPVTPATLFQAGSISKPVSALGALTLVEAGRLSLDEDVNGKLKSWRVPDNEFTTRERVTLRRLLTHTAGLTVTGFPGYDVTARVPSVPDILDGKGNTPVVRVDLIPGSVQRYSGGGFTVMQQLVEDVSTEPFAKYLDDRVLRPLGMASSTFQQPLPQGLARGTATGHLVDRSQVQGRWHVYPEKAAAGLWTTPTDLAKYIIGVQQAVAGKSKVLSSAMVRQMLTDQKNGMGLGPAVEGSGPTLRFSHNGRVRGFDALLIGYAESGDGLVVMINGNDNSALIQGNCCQNRIVNLVAKQYEWRGYPIETAEAVTPGDLTRGRASSVAGRYEFQNPTMMALGEKDGHLYSYVDGLPDEEFVYASDGRFVSTERTVSFRVSRDAAGDVDAIDWIRPNAPARRIPRTGPLFSAIHASADADPAFTATVLTAIQTLAGGGKATAESPLLTAGARKEFTAPVSGLQGVRALRLRHVANVDGRGIERLSHPIQRVLHYAMDTDRGQRWLLVHLDPNGLVADFDVVGD
jgi:CubicO group peptidase (beta-lactamase class C family)